MSTGTPEAARNHSRSRLASRAAPGLVSGVRAALAVAGAVGVLLVVAATFATVIEITVAGNANITADIDRTASGWDRHNVALLLLAGFALVMLVGALRGGRPAMFALATCGLAVLLIAVIGDAPDLDQTGPIGDLYEDARAQAGNGFYYETLGGALLLIAGVGLLVLGAGDGAARATSRAPGAVGAQDEPTAPGGAGVAVRRIGAGAATAVARAREAATDQAAARRERTQARRERQQVTRERARERAEAAAAAETAREREQAASPPAEEPSPPARAAAPAEPAGEVAAGSTRDVAGAEPATPAPRSDAPAAASDPGKLSFDERLREARERARRKP